MVLKKRQKIQTVRKEVLVKFKTSNQRIYLKKAYFYPEFLK